MAFAVVQLAWQGREVTVVEHMSVPGKKLLITGKGRCNVTNNSGRKCYGEYSEKSEISLFRSQLIYP